MPPTTPTQRAFTLVELLVVISIIALLIAILLPSLRRARAQSKLVVCAQNLRQVGLSIQMYSSENSGSLPLGPEPPAGMADFCFACQNTATNQVWDPADPFFGNTYIGLGILLRAQTVVDPRILFCPSDDNFNLAEEEPKIGTPTDAAFSSYIYRQIDMTPPGAQIGRLDQMGVNAVNGVKVKVEALAWDAQALGEKPTAANPNANTYHKGKESNILIRDTSVRRFANVDDVLSIPNAAFLQANVGNVAPLRKALDQIAINADFAYRGWPTDAPQLP